MHAVAVPANDGSLLRSLYEISIQRQGSTYSLCTLKSRPTEMVQDRISNQRLGTQLDDGHGTAGSKSNDSLLTNATEVMVGGKNEGGWAQPVTAG